MRKQALVAKRSVSVPFGCCSTQWGKTRTPHLRGSLKDIDHANAASTPLLTFSCTCSSAASEPFRYARVIQRFVTKQATPGACLR